jgi:hypothetical protein
MHLFICKSMSKLGGRSSLPRMYPSRWLNRCNLKPKNQQTILTDDQFFREDHYFLPAGDAAKCFAPNVHKQSESSVACERLRARLPMKTKLDRN